MTVLHIHDNKKTIRHPSSFRDPSGHVFSYKGSIYRQVNKYYQGNYELLRLSGLADELIGKGLLINFEEISNPETVIAGEFYKVLKPRQIPYISYPYEWTFTQLKDAALLTLEVQKISIEHGITLKDASAYNIQFIGESPIFIDTLSFEKYHEGQPWSAYKQFCQHFLGPLALVSYRDVRLAHLLKSYIDGLPLDLVSNLLPRRSYLRFSILSHIHLHARAQKKYAGQVQLMNLDQKFKNKKKLSKLALLGIIDSLEAGIKNLKWNPSNTEWGDYYNDTNYQGKSQTHKAELIQQFIREINPKMVWDLGANNGFYSSIPSKKDIYTVAFDIDPIAVEKNYRQNRKHQSHMLPLVLDITNPSPNIGWANKERNSISERGPVDMVMALALIHHIAISNNVPMESIASYFAEFAQTLIIEFVPKEDTQVRRLLTTREDVFHNYNVNEFEKAFGRQFDILQKSSIEDSERTLYLLRKIENAKK